MWSLTSQHVGAPAVLEFFVCQPKKTFFNSIDPQRTSGPISAKLCAISPRRPVAKC